MQGPDLNLTSDQSPLAPVLLQLVIQILQDEAYVARLQRHYQMFKASLAAEGEGEKAVKRKRPYRKSKKRRR